MFATTATTATTAVLVVAGVEIPASVQRGDEAKRLIQALIGNDDLLLSLADGKAKAGAAVAVALGYALSAMIYGDKSRLARAKARAISVARERGKGLDKAGNLTGSMGRMFQAFADAADLGEMFKDLLSDEIDLTVLLSSPLCPALPAPKKAPAKAPAPAPVTATIKRTARDQAARDRAARTIRTLRATIRALQAPRKAAARRKVA